MMGRTDQELRELLDSISAERATMKPGEYPEEQPMPATALPDGMEERLRYRVENPSAWPEGFDQEASDLMRDAAGALAAMRVERDRNATEYETVLNSYADENQRLHDRVEAAEQQVRDMKEGQRETFILWIRSWVKKRFGVWITNNTAKGAYAEYQESARLLLKEGGE